MQKKPKNGKPNSRSQRRSADPSSYPFEIPSREAMLAFLDDSDGPVRLPDLVRHFGMQGEDRREAMHRRLRAMERDGQIVYTRAGYARVSSLALLRGRVIGHPDGFAFVVTEEPGDDVFLPPQQACKVLHGDRAIVSIVGVDRRGRPEGRVIEVIDRANNEVVGRYKNDGGIGVVVPDNRRLNQPILVRPDGTAGAVNGQIVIARIVQQPEQGRGPIGVISEILGEHLAPGMEIDIAIREHELPHVWPEAVLEEAKRIRQRLPEAEVSRRIDLRDQPFVTIDGEDARDFDDAVYAHRDGRGWKLFVAIADVSYYVIAGTALDNEAHARGNSVYFPDHVIPMLPEVLSNELCSLKPRVDRFAVVCEMSLDARGEVRQAEFYEAVIQSRARLTYTEVAAAVGANDIWSDNARAVQPQIAALHALYRVLLARRLRRGALEIDTIEPRITFDAQRKIASFTAIVRNDAHRMIEEFMVAANVATAEFLIGEEVASLFRVHARPDGEKVDNLRRLLAELGLALAAGDKPLASEFAGVLQQARDKPFAHLVETVVLRSMKMAVYSPDNVGHFGLAYDAYMHFTSPIRRYPDLVVHRAIKSVLNGPDCDPYGYSREALSQLGDHCSMTERRADEATRDALSWLKCEYMLDRVGEVFDGTISGVTSFGLFVELDDLFVEGLIHVTSLPRDYYQFDAVHHRLRGDRTGKAYQLGDRLVVAVARVSLDDRKIDFELRR